MLRNASGLLKLKIDTLFKRELSAEDRSALAMLIYYPEKKINIISQELDDMSEWYHINLLRIIRLCKRFSAKYTRSKIRKALPKEFAYIMEELLNEQVDTRHKEKYYEEIIYTMIDLGKAKDFLCAFCYLIQRLAVDHLHILGDIYDRGPRPDRVIETLINHHSVDIQWGNHDILWMGAASGNLACIANVIRICCRYNNLEILEDGYGINLLPLATFALEHYKDVDTSLFIPKDTVESNIEHSLLATMHKAITLIQFKLEGQLIDAYPEFNMQNRKLLHLIDYTNKTIQLEGITYTLKDCQFPTIDCNNPYTLTSSEVQLMQRLQHSFVTSAILQYHIKYLFSKGNMYTIYNNNLLYHGCILLNRDGTFKTTKLNDKKLKGKAYLDTLSKLVREGYFGKINSVEKQYGEFLMWYLWCGKNSPLFGKDKMATFERYLIEDQTLHSEEKNPYYQHIEDEQLAIRILKEFNLNPDSGHIINGHVPVKIQKGESPIKGQGKIFIIDGGFTKAYQKLTGIAGYTLISDSTGIKLASHMPFEGIDHAIKSEKDLVTTINLIEQVHYPIQVKDTDIGHGIKEEIDVLLKLVHCYKTGLLQEK